MKFVKSWRMPYRSEKILIAGTKYDSRRKLSDEQRQAVAILHREGYSYRKLAEMFGVSKRLIQSIIRPPKRNTPRPRPTSYWTVAKRRYRQRKQALYNKGLITFKKNKRNAKK